MLTRIAVVTVLFCIGILLLSACGFGGPARMSMPFFPFQEFLLWQVEPGAPDRLLATGSASGTNGELLAHLDLLPTLCPRTSTVHLKGLLDSTTTVRFEDDRSMVKLTGAFQPRSKGFSEYLVPFSGTLTLEGICDHSSQFPVEARPTPVVHAYWHLPSRSPGPYAQVTLLQAQAAPGGPIYEWGTISFAGSNCARGGSFAAMLDPAQTSLDADILMGGGSILHVPGLPTKLGRGAPHRLQTTASFTGGPCQGQTIPIDLVLGRSF